MGYLGRMKEVGHFSLQSRCEPYVVLYIWKIMAVLVPNFGIDTDNNPQTGRLCAAPKVPPSLSRMRTEYCKSLVIDDPQYFNVLPGTGKIKDWQRVDINVFKKCLEKSLSAILDKPTS